MRRPDITPAEHDQMVARYSKGESVKQLAKAFGCSRMTVRYHVSPKTRERQAAYRSVLKNPNDFLHTISGRVAKEDERARFAELPRYDNRSLTGRMFGDPLPERSALAGRA